MNYTAKMRLHLLGIVIDSITMEEARKKVADFLRHDGQHLVVTPNPEFLLLARRDREFRQILNGSSLALPDGAGLFFAARIFGKSIKERITGVRFVHLLCEDAAATTRTVFFLGSTNGVAKRASEMLRQRYPTLRVCGAISGGRIQRLADGQWTYENGNIFATIRQAKPDILFVALGQGKQEKWIADNCTSLPSVKIAMGVGGALDYIAGTASWAPAWMRVAGLEWLWRLMHEPRRWKRIFNAVIVFPMIVLYERFKK